MSNLGIGLGGGASQLADIDRRRIANRDLDLQERALEIQEESDKVARATKMQKDAIEAASSFAKEMQDIKSKWTGTTEDFDARTADLIANAAAQFTKTSEMMNAMGISSPDLGQQMAAQIQATPTAREAGIGEARSTAQASAAQREELIAQGFSEEQANQLIDLEPEGLFDFGGSLGGKARSIVLDLQGKVDRGGALSPEEQRAFNLARSEIERKRVVGSADTGFFQVSGRLDPETGQLVTDVQPVSDPRRSPERAGRQAAAQQSKENIGSVVREVIKVSPEGAMNVNKQLLSQMIINLPFSRGRLLRARMEDSIQQKLRLETGATANESELASISERFLPSLLDSDEQIVDKFKRLERFFDLALSGMGVEQLNALAPGIGETIQGIQQRGTDVEQAVEQEQRTRIRFDAEGNIIQ